MQTTGDVTLHPIRLTFGMTFSILDLPKDQRKSILIRLMQDTGVISALARVPNAIDAVDAALEAFK